MSSHRSTKAQVDEVVTGLNGGVFRDRPIDNEAVFAICQLGAERAIQLCQLVESRSGDIGNPSGWLKNAAKKDGVMLPPLSQAHGKGDAHAVATPPPPPAATRQHQSVPTAPRGKGGGKEDNRSKVHRRVTWLSANVFAGVPPIEDRAIDALATLPIERAMEILKMLEEKAAEVRNPNGWLLNAVRREGPTAEAAMVTLPPRPPPQPTGGQRPVRVPPPAANPSPAAEYSQILQRITWLNENVLYDRPIDSDASGAMLQLGLTAAIHLFNILERQGNAIANPSQWLQDAAKNGGRAPAPPPPSPAPSYGGYGKSGWDQATAAWDSSWKGGKGGGKAGPRPLAQRGSEEFIKVHKRITWLNANVFTDRKIDEEAIQALASLGIGRAFELCKEVEEKQAHIQNPAGWLKNAAKKEGVFLPPLKGSEKGGEKPGPKIGTYKPPPARPSDAEHEEEEGAESWDRGDDEGATDAAPGETVEERVAWLNTSMFTESAIEEDAIEALNSVAPERALELLQGLEKKGPEVKNPSGYLKAAVRREFGELRPPAGVKRVGSGQGGPPQKRASY